MNEWESVEMVEGADTAVSWEQMAEELPTTIEERREIKGQAKVYFDRGGGWFIIGPPYEWEIGDHVELPSKDGVIVEVQSYDERWGERDGLMSSRIAEDFGI
jgi:hypothetical protein